MKIRRSKVYLGLLVLLHALAIVAVQVSVGLLVWFSAAITGLLLLNLLYQLFQYHRSAWSEIWFETEQLWVTRGNVSFPVTIHAGTVLTQWLLVLRVATEDGERLNQLLFQDALSDHDYHSIKMSLKNRLTGSV